MLTAEEIYVCLKPCTTPNQWYLSPSKDSETGAFVYMTGYLEDRRFSAGLWFWGRVGQYTGYGPTVIDAIKAALSLV